MFTFEVSKMPDVFKAIPARSILIMSFIPVHCCFRFVFPVYNQDTFELFVLKCLLLSVGFWLGRSKFSIPKMLCHIYVGILPVLFISFIPESMIIGACSNFLMMMFMTVFEDNIKSLFVLVISNALAWILFATLRLSLEIERLQEKEVKSTSQIIKFWY